MQQVKVELLPNMTPTESASHAGLRCYQSKPPEIGKIIDVENNLFRVSHHTTIQHASSYNTSGITGISVGDITFGLHLVSPFYNSCQQSGRYAAKMFTNPDFSLMMDYVQSYWPEVGYADCLSIESYLRKAFSFYQTYKEKADDLAERILKEERPFIKEDMLKRIAPKVAQEQLRMFIPVIFPTSLDFTLNLTALVAMYEESWTPAMRNVTKQMAEAVIEKHPDIAYMFNGDRRVMDDWWIPIPRIKDITVSESPHVFSCRVVNEDVFVQPTREELFPVDRSHFSPRLMNNSIGDIEVEVAISVATMGQDQRHRTLRRGTPSFTGGFYLPPVLQELYLSQVATHLMQEWITVSAKLPGTLGMMLAPYGAMVSYTKKGSFNAVAHEQFKRLCWCAQEEIYWLGVLERQAIERECGRNSKLLGMFQPPCYANGKCAEGGRYCGRDISVRETGNYFPRRGV